MASKSKHKLLAKIGIVRKNKASALTISTSSPKEPVFDNVEISDEYCLPPDCDIDDAVYCEPADSLNLSSETSSAVLPAGQSSSEITINSYDRANDSDNPPSIELSQSVGSQTPSVNSNTSLTGASSSTTDFHTISSANDNNMDVSSAQPTAMSSVIVTNKQYWDATSNHEYYNQEAIVRNHELNNSSAAYANDSQTKVDGLKTQLSTSSSQHIVCPSEDPRNYVNTASGDEYDCPWDLRDTETELYQLVKQVKNKVPPSLNLAAVNNNKHEKVVTPRSPNVCKQLPDAKECHRFNQMANSKEGTHNIRQPKTKRMSSTSSMSSAVLVEGEWREAKPGVMSTSPNTPEFLSSPPVISQTSSSASSHNSTLSTNAASNVIYDKTADEEIQGKLRYTEERPKVPCAQPRTSVSHSSDSSSVYQNYNDTYKPNSKESSADPPNDELYEEPWSTDKIQQDIMDKLQNQNLHHHQSQQKPNVRRQSSSDSNSNFRPPSDSNRNISRVSTSSLASEKVEKLSPRALTSSRLHKPSTAPPIPKTGPGQAHANKPSKPVLVVHKTNVAVLPPQLERQSSAGRGSLRKKPSSPDVPECQHRIGLGVNRNLPLTQQLWYHGAIQRYYAEDLLRRQPDGSFLVRDTSGSSRDKTLSLKNMSGFIHIKIVQQPDGTYILGQFSHPFKSIMEMVEYYSRHKVNIKGAEHTYLEIPVLRD